MEEAGSFLQVGLANEFPARLPWGMAEPVVVYTYARCSTCRDAVKWLTEHDIPFVEKPIYETPPTVPELRRMLAAQGGALRRLFNVSGLEYKAQSLKERLPDLSQGEALALLAGNGRLVKRPFLLGPDIGLVGFKPDEWAAALIHPRR